MRYLKMNRNSCHFTSVAPDVLACIAMMRENYGQLRSVSLVCQWPPLGMSR